MLMTGLATAAAECILTCAVGIVILVWRSYVWTFVSRLMCDVAFLSTACLMRVAKACRCLCVPVRGCNLGGRLGGLTWFRTEECEKARLLTRI